MPDQTGETLSPSEITTKRCSKCGEDKPLGEFARRPDRGDGLATFCRECKSTYDAARRAADPLGMWAYSIYRTAKHRARMRKVPYELTPRMLVDLAPTHCPVLGIPLDYGGTGGRGRVGPQASSPSVDRVSPSLGYVPGNVVVMSHRANSIKSNATSAELYRVAEWLAQRGY